MLHVFYFDWNGTTDELKAYCKKVESACDKAGVTYKGCYGPPQDHYHYAMFMENKKAEPMNPDYNKFNPVFAESGGKPPQMGHIVMKYYVNLGY
jgi:hypothetical protein